ncbi:MAG TPA: AMP-binding protein [Candidatus Angelobacter sp.]|nr:AMP-binding protein [Candidatus Angelobacter sp.]
MTQSPPTNVADLLHATAAGRPDDVAFVDAETGRETTWGALDASVDAMAAGLRRHGLGRGDRIALMLGNRVEFVAMYFAALRAGMIAVPLNTAYTAHEVADLLARSGARLLVVDEAAEPVASVATADVPTDLVVVGDRDYLAIERAGHRADAPRLAEEEFDPESTAVLLFTSGTSGPSRGAMLSHRALLANIGQLRSIDPEPMQPDDIVLVVLPLFHVYALNAVLGLAVATGARSVLVPRFSPASTLEVVGALEVTHVPAAPQVFVAWSHIPDLDRRLAGVRTLVSGAAPLAPAVFRAFEERAGMPVWEGYGLTEASPVVSSTMVGRRPKPGCVGSPLPGVEIRLVDEEGADVDEDDPGEIWVRGANLFSGYWPDGSGGPDDDGWYATGDVGYRDEDGDLHLVDRRRDLILVSGFNVYPFEIETVIAGHPDVAEVAVVGIPHEHTGEAVKAFVAPLPGRTVTREQIAALCESRLARFKCPTVIEVVDRLPHSSTGKIARARLREGAS